MSTPASTDLRWRMRLSIVTTELQHTSVQLRFVAALLAAAMIRDLADPAILLLTRSETLLYRVAASTWLGPVATGWLFAGLALLLLPFLAVQLWQRPRVCRTVTKVAVLVLALTGLLWIFLAWRSTHLDLGATAQVLIALQGAGALLFALALALSLNAEQLRTLMERPE